MSAVNNTSQYQDNNNQNNSPNTSNAGSPSGSGLFGAIASIGMGIANQFQTKRQNRLNRKFQMQENQRSRDFALEMWNRNNEYNSMVNQMQRLRDAGINPHLAYMNGSGMNASNAPAQQSGISPLPAGQAPQFDIYSTLALSKELAEIEKINAEADNIRSNTSRTDVLAGIDAITLSNSVEMQSQQIALNNLNLRIGDTNIQFTDQQINESSQRVINLISENENLQQTLENLKIKYQLDQTQISSLLVQIGVSNATIKEINSRVESNYQDIEESKERTKNYSAVRSHLNSSTEYNTQLIRELNRSNRIGDLYDEGNAKQGAINTRLNTRINGQVLDQMKSKSTIFRNDVSRLELENFMLKVQSAEQIGGAPGRILQNYLPFGGSSSESSQSTYNYDKDGNYKGHSTTNRKSKNK